jgi:predicted metal-dependent hydrolase
MKRLKVTPGEQLSLALDAGNASSVASGPQLNEAPVRRIQVGPALLTYRLRRARRRSIGFQIDDQGLTVSAPRWVPLREIEAAIAEKQRWITAKQREWQEWRARRRLPQVRFVHGAALPYLGGEVALRLGTSSAVTTLDAAELHVALPPDASELRVRDTVQAWLQSEARRVFQERIERFADRIHPRYAGWTLSSARSQWGSCTHDGRVRLSWRLIHFSLPVIDYVVAHELAHLAELNHGPRFWNTVAQLLPGFEIARNEIRRVDMAALPL